ncbi:MAG: hypothetical protein HY877_05515 [Deltaproteobacteria bacterium]|nr:hypothetical protein [Deltaproteobacteria bacterium]
MLEFDFSKSGLKPEDFSGAKDLEKNALKKISEERQSKKIGWWGLPWDKKGIQQIKKTAASFSGDFDTLVVLGIGGSSQGLKTLYQALGAQLSKKLFVIESPDPRSVAKLAESINPATTLFNVISKSGNTVETLALFDFFRPHVQPEQWVVTCEEGKNPLYAWAKENNAAHLPVPENVGGRFSVFSAVGLFPIFFLGIDGDALLDGARKVEEEDGAFKNGLIHYLLDRNYDKKISVMMPYADCLENFGGWYAQLWAESLGKDGKGQTPVVVVGPQGQHSVAQLFLEGPQDKVVTLINVASDASSPLGELLQRECRATRDALADSGCPVVTLTLPEISPFYMGKLMMFYQTQTAFTGHLMNINPYDQPAVEQIKRRIPKPKKIRWDESGRSHLPWSRY